MSDSRQPSLPQGGDATGARGTLPLLARHRWRLIPGLLILASSLVTLLLLATYLQARRVPLDLLLPHLPMALAMVLGVGLAAAFILGDKRGGLRVSMAQGFLLVSFCPSVFLTFLHLDGTLDSLEKNAAKSLQESALHNGKIVDVFIRENLEDIRTYALFADFSIYLEMAEDKRSGSAIENRVLDLLLALQRRDPLNITSCALFDRKGRDLVDTNSEDMGLSKADREYFRRPLQTGRPYASTQYKAELSRVPSIYFSSPVRNTAGQIIGVFRVRYNALVLQQLLLQRGDLQIDSSRRVRLYDLHQVLYVDSMLPPQLFVRDSGLPFAEEVFATGQDPADPLALAGRVGDLQQGAAATKLFRAREGAEERLYAAFGLSEGPWLVVVDQGMSGYYQAISKQIGNAAMLIGLVALAVVFIASLVGGRIVRPLQRLTDAAGAMEGGSLDIRVEGGRDQETRVLAEAFNAMTGRLRRAMDELRRSEEDYRLLVENQNDLVLKFDLNGGIRFVSPSCCQVFGESEEKLLQLSFVDLLHEDDRQTMLQATAALAPPPHAALLELRTLGVGGWSWFSWSFKALIGKDGLAVAIIAAGRDISERKRNEEEQARLHGQLLQAQKMESVGRLAGGIAHDFNNMLNVILGHCELALLQSPSDDQLSPHFQAIRGAAQRSAELTRRLLAFARRQTIAPRVIDLNATVGGMLEMLRQLIGEDIHLAWMPGKGLWSIKADPSQLDQILANLCVNARDAISGVGKVTIETGTASFDHHYCSDHPGFLPGDYTLLAVSDNGCGMNEETKSRLFEPFFTTKETGKGTGLGLATIYGIVKQNRGFINIYSEPGQGSTFKIYFPRHFGPREETALEVSPLHHGGFATVLVVEDERMILDVTKTMLESLGYKVLAASTVEEALRLTEEHADAIEVLLSDVVMPEMNGKDLAGILTAKCPGMQVLFMSGYTANVIAHHGVLESGVHFIQKPFTMAELAAAVGRTRVTSEP